MWASGRGFEGSVSVAENEKGEWEESERRKLMVRIVRA
jgi:hypothetical protein